MSALALQRLIGTALTDSSFCSALLNGSRRRILSGFPLSGDEVESIMAIQADTLEDFAREVHLRFLAKTDEIEPLPRLRTRAVFGNLHHMGVKSESFDST